MDNGSITSNIAISLKFNIENNNHSFKELCKSIGMNSRRREIDKFEIDVSFTLIENTKIPQIGEIEKAQIQLCTFFNIGEKILSEIIIVHDFTKKNYDITMSKFLTPLYSHEGSYPFEILDYEWKGCTCYFRGMQLVSLYADNISKKSISALPVLYTIFRIIASELEKVDYLGPLREAPNRQYILQDIYEDIGVKGENTAHYLGQYGQNESGYLLPYCKGKKIETVTLQKAVSRWAEFMGIEHVSVKTDSIQSTKLTQIMVGDQNIADVGFGVSQVLPIIVEGLTMASGNTLILEQPEIHLHPRMQMDIADFLLNLAQQEKNLIIETHSDHIINRIVRRVLEDKSLMGMIGIYYIEKDENGNSNLTEVKIDEKLGIDVAPQGFFDQYASETEKILQAGYANMRAERGRISD